MICVWVYMTFVWVYICSSPTWNVYARIYICICIYVYICMYMCMYMHKYVCIYVCICAGTCIYIHTYMYIRAYTFHVCYICLGKREMETWIETVRDEWSLWEFESTHTHHKVTHAWIPTHLNTTWTLNHIYVHIYIYIHIYICMCM